MVHVPFRTRGVGAGTVFTGRSGGTREFAP